MKQLGFLPMVLAGIILFSPATAQAGEALPELKGEWVVETEKGKELPFTLTYEFVNDEKLVITLVNKGKTQVSEVAYKANKHGVIKVYDGKIGEDGNPDKGSWEIKDGKLHITTRAMGTVLSRKPEPAED
jgi:hypothetical protein